jgi:hypothetical protein
MEPFFEQNPWLVIPMIIVVVESWSALKRLIAIALRKNDDAAESERPAR